MSPAGRTIAITRDALSADEFISIMAREGVRVLPVKTMTLRPAGKAAGDNFMDLLSRKRHDYIAFLSPTSVRVLFEITEPDQLRSKLENTVVLAIGPATCEALRKSGIIDCKVPSDFSSAGLVELLSSRDPYGKGIIIPRSAEADSQLADTLLGLGMQVDEVDTYSIEAAGPTPELLEVAALLRVRKIDAVVFTSASNVRNFFRSLEIAFSGASGSIRIVDDIKQGLKGISIGPQTSAELQREGVGFVESSEHTIRGVAELAKKVLV